MEHRFRILLVSILLPFFIIAGIFFKAVYPLKFGKPVLLSVHPVDPRDLLRGHYVDLRYDFSEIKVGEIPTEIPRETRFNYGDTLYLQLHQKTTESPATMHSLHSKKPETGLFLKVTPRSSFLIPKAREDNYSLDLIAGIESYFVPKVEASSLEKQVRKQNVLARVFISDSGEARIESLLAAP